MNYYECGDLYSFIKNQNGVYFEEKLIVHWFVQICLALKVSYLISIDFEIKFIQIVRILNPVDWKYINLVFYACTFYICISLHSFLLL